MTAKEKIEQLRNKSVPLDEIERMLIDSRWRNVYSGGEG